MGGIYREGRGLMKREKKSFLKVKSRPFKMKALQFSNYLCVWRYSLWTWPSAKLFTVWRQPFQTCSWGHHKQTNTVKLKFECCPRSRRLQKFSIWTLSFFRWTRIPAEVPLPPPSFPPSSSSSWSPAPRTTLLWGPASCPGWGPGWPTPRTSVPTCRSLLRSTTQPRRWPEQIHSCRSSFSQPLVRSHLLLGVRVGPVPSSIV